MTEPPTAQSPASDTLASETLAPVIVVTSAHPGVDPAACVAALAVGCQEAGLAVRVAVLVRAVPQAEWTDAVAGLTGAVVSTAHALTSPPGALTHPPTLARRHGVRLTPAVVHATLVAAMARSRETDLVVLHDPLGLLVPIDADGATLLDVADSLGALGVRVGFVLVTGDGSDDLAPTLLVADVLRSRKRDVLGLAVQARGRAPSATAAALLADCADLTLLGIVPWDAATWDPQTFQDRAGAWLPVL
jgi:dethiobiotin synthetase